MSDLRVIVGEVRGARTAGTDRGSAGESDFKSLANQFNAHLQEIRATLEQYREHLVGNDPDDSAINDSREEWETVHKIDAALERIVDTTVDAAWIA